MTVQELLQANGFTNKPFERVKGEKNGDFWLSMASEDGYKTVRLTEDGSEKAGLKICVPADHEGSILEAEGRIYTAPPSAVDHVNPDTGDVTVRPFRKDRATRSIGLAWRRRSVHRKMIHNIAEVIADVVRHRFAGVVFAE